jgi:hypothetical protein
MRNILVNKGHTQDVEDCKVNVIIELSVGMGHGMVNLAMSTFWLLICFMKKPALSGCRQSNGNAMGIVVV